MVSPELLPLLEYSSLVFGFRFLTLPAVATYGMSWLTQGRARPAPQVKGLLYG
jgi:hypothetical protein